MTFRFTLIIYLICFTLSWTSSTLFARENMLIPDDFKIYLHTTGRIPNSSAYAILIKSSGHCKYFERSAGLGEEFKLVKEFDLDVKSMQKIYNTITQQKFFELKPKYIDPGVQDGDLAEMEITADGKNHRVKTINMRVDDFDGIVLEINTHLLEGVQIRYNALHVKSHKGVKR